MWAPRVEETEALQLEARYFLDCVAEGKRPFNDGRAGWRVVRILEAAEESLNAAKRWGTPHRVDRMSSGRSLVASRRVRGLTR